MNNIIRIDDEIKIELPNNNERYYIDIEDKIVKNSDGSITDYIESIRIESQSEAIKNAANVKKELKEKEDEFKAKFENLTPEDKNTAIELLRERQNYFKNNQ